MATRIREKAIARKKNADTRAFAQVKYVRMSPSKVRITLDTIRGKKVEEAMAIRWHMGGFDDSARAGNYSIGEAFKRYPLAVMAHLADLEATYLLEKGTSAVNK